MNLHAIATLAFRLAGLFGLTWALGSLPAALLIPNLRTQAGLLVVARGDWSQFIAAVIRLAAGLAVTVRAGRLSAWCTRVQETAAKEPAP